MGWMVLGVIALGVVGFGLYGVGIYNGLVALKHAVDRAWANIDRPPPSSTVTCCAAIWRATSRWSRVG